MYVIRLRRWKTLLVGDYPGGKVAYDPRCPIRRFRSRFVHYTMPSSHENHSSSGSTGLTTGSVGFGHVQRNDAVVFNFPEGDTVVLDDPTANYDILRQYQLRYGPDRGREALLQQHEIITRPVDKRENYIKRAVAPPGDTLQVIHSTYSKRPAGQSRIPNKQYVFISPDGRYDDQPQARG